ncbi:MAG: hypothetical protein Q9160_009214 [Pyrenula sp. 1 TL-2023]
MFMLALPDRTDIEESRADTEQSLQSQSTAPNPEDISVSSENEESAADHDDIPMFPEIIDEEAGNVPDHGLNPHKDAVLQTFAALQNREDGQAKSAMQQSTNAVSKRSQDVPREHDSSCDDKNAPALLGNSDAIRRWYRHINEKYGFIDRPAT